MTVDHPLLSKFDRSLVLTEAERYAIFLVPMRLETVKADQAILREGVRPSRCFLLVSGLACSSKVTLNGRRQILAFHVPEDMPDLTSLHLEVRDCDTWALTDCELGFVEHSDLLELCDENPRLARFLWRATLVEASIHREWTLNVGQREGLARMAHVLCEMMLRLQTVGLARDRTCALQLTQEDLAEATGMSTVHVNRVLQELRRQKLITFGQGRLTIHDWDQLTALADFQTGYLHLLPAKAAA